MSKQIVKQSGNSKIVFEVTPPKEKPKQEKK